MILNKVFNKVMLYVVLSKIYIRRTMSYVSLMNTSMILFLFLSDLKKYGIELNLKEMLIPVSIGTLFIIILIGYVEDKLGFYTREVTEIQNRNKVLMKMQSDIKEIKRYIK